MNRLQKKCVIATAGIHLLLLLILVFGSAFFSSRPRPDDTQVLDVIPANLIDAAFSSGVKNTQPPTPTPVVIPPPQPQPVQPAPKPVEPTPTFIQKVEKLFTPEPKPDLTPVEKQNPSRTPKVSLKPVVRNVPKTSPDNSQNQSQTIKSTLRTLKKNLSKGTTVDMPGDSSTAYASYASVVKSVYDQAWTLPDTVANDEENVKVSVTIARDGTVISSRIVSPSGDAAVDSTVQRTLDRVTFVAPFPDGATERERTYIINFNPKAKRMLE